MVPRAISDQLCACGCGEHTFLRTVTNARFGWKKGEPLKYITGHNARGRTLSEETKRRVGASHFREKSVDWKGEEAEYSAIHRWVRRNYEKTGACEHCDREGKTDWANIDHLYRRTREDWIELCRSCHYRFDHPSQSVAA